MEIFYHPTMKPTYQRRCLQPHLGTSLKAYSYYKADTDHLMRQLVPYVREHRLKYGFISNYERTDSEFTKHSLRKLPTTSAERNRVIWSSNCVTPEPVFVALRHHLREMIAVLDILLDTILDTMLDLFWDKPVEIIGGRGLLYGRSPRLAAIPPDG